MTIPLYIDDSVPYLRILQCGRRPISGLALDMDVLVITINVNQVEALNEIVPPNTQGNRDVDFERRLQG